MSRFKRAADIFGPMFLVAMLMAAGCATLGVEAPKTFNERALAAEGTIQGVVNTANVLLTAHKISIRDAENVVTQATNATEAVAVARTLHAADAGAGEDRLTAIITGLNAISAYLNSRKGG